jgi:monovalent cation:H+ antiporter, CPA1 family
MITITAVLSLFSLLVVSSVVFYAARRFKVPYTVLLVLVGILLVPIAQAPGFNTILGFITDLKLTPELLFYIFLPTLIFESAFNMSIRRMVDNVWSISLLAVLGLLVSTALIAGGLYFILPLIGVEIPFIVALLFGAIISSTDPVAVLALFKEFGAPKRLTMIFEGESLFNDGTAVALFLVILAIANEGFHGAETVAHGFIMFVSMVAFGILFGIAMATLLSKALKYTRDDEFVTVTLLIISAHLVFILSELINEHGLLGLDIHVSSIIATTFSSLFLGNYTRHILAPKTDEYTSKFIEHLAFMANSLVFVLAGLLFASSGINIATLGVPILATVLIVAAVRVIQVFAVTELLNGLKLEAPIPRNWQLLLAWGSLRGALAIIIVLLIPDDFMVTGWQYSYSPKEFLLSLTIGCILATLFIKAPLMGPIMRKLHVNDPEPLHQAHMADLGVYYLLAEKSRFEAEKDAHFMSDSNYKKLISDVDQCIVEAKRERTQLLDKHGQSIFDQSLHLVMLNSEQYALKELWVNKEVNENVFRRINGKLLLQKELIDNAQHDSIDPSKYTDHKDIFDRLMRPIDPFSKHVDTLQLTEKFQYYRAQILMSQYAIQRLKATQQNYGIKVFYKTSYDKVLTTYEGYRKESAKRLNNLLEEHGADLTQELTQTASRSIIGSGNRALEQLKLYGFVNEEMQQEVIEHWGKKLQSYTA